MWFDTHAHLAYSPLLENVKQYYDQAKEAGVGGVLTIGTDLESSKECVRIAEQFDHIWAAVGIHPNECAKAGDEDWKRVVELTDHPKVVALGETGLDKYWDDAPFDLQQEFFQQHIDHSKLTGLPLVIHMRECEKEIVDFLEGNAQSGSINGIMHSFTGSEETVQKCESWGMHISFAGMLTFKNAAEIRDVAKTVSSDRLLVETDSPYLTPHPFRGKRPNHPALVAHTGKCLADCRDESVVEVQRKTTENACKLFNVLL